MSRLPPGGTQAQSRSAYCLAESSVQGAQTEEPKYEESGSNGHEAPLLAPPRHENGTRAQNEGRRDLDGDPSVGLGQEQVDHPPCVATGKASTPMRLRLMVSSSVLTPRTVTSGISSHSWLLKGSDATRLPCRSRRLVHSGTCRRWNSHSCCAEMSSGDCCRSEISPQSITAARPPLLRMRLKGCRSPCIQTGRPVHAGVSRNRSQVRQTSS